MIFDADGVLFDSTESNTSYYNAIYAEVGEPPLSPEEEKAGVFMSAVQVFELRAGGDQARLARMREVARALDFTPFFKLLRQPFELRPFLTEIKRRYRIGLATNRSATVPGLIEHLGLDGVFEAVASARDKVRPKPAPDILTLCLKRADVAAARAVYVGDSETDRIAAMAAGTCFIGVGARVDHEPRIDRLEQLPDILSRSFGNGDRAN
ncbi:MAG: HAD family hydrolase [Stellaceae bacterium]